MYKIILGIILILTIKPLYCNDIDSLNNGLDTLPIIEKLEFLGTLNYEILVTNNQELIPIYLKYIEIAKAQKKTAQLAKLYEMLSLAYYFNGKYDKNFECGLMAIHLYDSLNNNLKLGNMYGELGYQMKRRDLPKAFKLMQTGLHILESNDFPEQLAKIYDNYGILHEMNSNIDSAIYFYNKALIIKQELKDSIGIPYTLCNIFMSHMIINKTDSALWYLDEATRIRTLTHDRIGLAECYNYYGDFYTEKGHTLKAIDYYKKTLEKALEYNYTNLANQMYERIAYSYEILNNYAVALDYYKLHKLYQDSLVNAETNKNIANLQVKYETAEKEKQLIIKNEELKNQQFLKWIFLAISVFIALTVWIFFKYKLVVSRRNEQIKTQQALIEGEQNERNRLAMELHDGLGNELNGLILSFNNSLSNSTEKEKLTKDLTRLKETHQMVRQMSHNLMPRSLEQKGLKVALNDLTHSIKHPQTTITLQIQEFEHRLNSFVEFNVFRIIQETLNNSLKHAQASNILVNCSIINKQLLITIEDNGKGFELEEALKTKGIGLLNLSNRVKMLNGSLNIDSSINKGTSIEIQIPVSQT